MPYVATSFEWVHPQRGEVGHTAAARASVTSIKHRQEFRKGFTFRAPVNHTYIHTHTPRDTPIPGLLCPLATSLVPSPTALYA